MTPEEQARFQQGYIENPTPMFCAYCAEFTGRPPEKPHQYLAAERRVHHRCLLGNFIAKPGATCLRWHPKTLPPLPPNAPQAA